VTFVSLTLLLLGLVAVAMMICSTTVVERLIYPQIVEESQLYCHREILLGWEMELYIETEDTTVVELHSSKTDPMPWRTALASGV
jgi:hypothetical protein